MPLETKEDALLVPERALGTDQAGRYLLVVGKDNVVEYRAVKVGTEVGDLRVVEGKIGPDDRVVVDGLQRARPGLKVEPEAGRGGRPTPAAAARRPPTRPRRRRTPRRRQGLIAPPLSPTRDRMFSRFFIDRPIFANVIAIVTMLVGAVALFVLPIEQYPEITPPTVQVTTIYPGADAEVLADTVASPIEQEVNGVEDMLYMSSTCSSDGSYTLTVTFEVGTDLDKAQVLVQNRVAVAEPQAARGGPAAGGHRQEAVDQHHPGGLPDLARRPVRQPLPEQLRHAPGHATSSAGSTASATSSVLGSSNYGMRIWLDPEKLKARNLTTEDVLAAIREQNVQVAAGQVGQSPTPPGQNFQYTVTTLGRLSDPEQFGEIIVKTGEDGRQRRRG